MKKEDIESILFDFVHAETGWCDPLPPCCELEDVIIIRQTIVDDKIRVSFIYYYNEDWSSEKDMDHVLKGKALISKSGSIIKGSLKEFSTGIDVEKQPYQPKGDFEF